MRAAAEVETQQFLTITQDLPKAATALLALLINLSKGGKYKTYPTAEWLAAKLDVSLSTYHRARRILEKMKLVVIKRRKSSRTWNLPSLFWVKPLRTMAKQVWDIMASRIVVRRKGVTNDTQTHSLTYQGKENTQKAKIMPWLKSDVYRKLVQEGLGKKERSGLGAIFQRK